MAVHAEPLPGLYAVVVDDPQCAEAHVGGIVIIAKGKRVVGVEPAVIEMAPLGSFAYTNHGCLQLFMCRLLTYQVSGQEKTGEANLQLVSDDCKRWATT